MDVQRRLRQLAEYLDGHMLKIGLTLGLTKIVEAFIATLVHKPAFKLGAWTLFLAAVAGAWLFQDYLTEKAGDAKETVEDAVQE